MTDDNFKVLTPEELEKREAELEQEEAGVCISCGS